MMKSTSEQPNLFNRVDPEVIMNAVRGHSEETMTGTLNPPLEPNAGNAGQAQSWLALRRREAERDITL
jgi:hypothetical protein